MDSKTAEYILVDRQGDLDGQVHDHETLGTNLERKDLHCVGDKQTRPGQSVAEGEDPNHTDDGLSSSLILVEFVLSRADGPDGEGYAHTCEIIVSFSKRLCVSR